MVTPILTVSDKALTAADINCWLAEENISADKVIVSNELVNNLFTARSMTVKITAKSTASGRTKELYYKSIKGLDVREEERAALRRDLLSNRNEANLYKYFGEDLRAMGVSIPKCYHVDCVGNIDDGDESVLASSGFSILIDCVDSNDYFQRSPLTASEARLSVELLADLHAASLGNLPLLKKAKKHLFARGGYWEMGKRGYALPNLTVNWANFRSAFADFDDECWLDTPEAAAMGERLERAALILCEKLVVDVDTPGACIIHGDAKAMNMFLPNNDEKGENGLLIDFQVRCAVLCVADADNVRHTTDTRLTHD
mgnify:CR=1 FL=1